ncbi:hypothetical protein TL16_g12490, partial [Triparma laevis f. inornata]|uniref:bleomycin hydrolase n=2 Tax=Triparma laevis TaxID=1534972 RepID=A0A9W7FQN5_9STRA
MSAAALSPYLLASAKKSYDSSPSNRVAQNAMSSNDPLTVLLNRDHAALNHQHHYSVRLSKELKATSQKASGRCWIFACLNVMRNQMAKKYDLPDTFQLSQTYTFYWDKLERANYFLNQIIDSKSEPLDERLVQHLLSCPMNDGGQWDMLVGVIEKYGVVPQSAYPDKWSSTASRRFNAIMTALLRDWAMQLRDCAEIPECHKLREKFMVEAHRIATIHFGKPPVKFDWTFESSGKEKKFTRFVDLTPKAFLKEHVPYNVSDQISLINDPRNEYYKLYTVHALGSVIDGPPVLYVNLPVSELKKYALQTLKDDIPVWFGCDVGKEFNRKTQIMDTEQFSYEEFYGTQPTQNKEMRLRYGQSLMTHAMVLVGADQPDASAHPTKWRVENSWGAGDDNGDAGFAMLTDAWFDEYMYQVVVEKKRIEQDDKIKEALKGEVAVLPAWDPMGALA